MPKILILGILSFIYFFNQNYFSSHFYQFIFVKKHTIKTTFLNKKKTFLFYKICLFNTYEYERKIHGFNDFRGYISF